MAESTGHVDTYRSLRTYRYVVDDHNRIVEVDEAWLRFARENDAPHLDREAVVGKSLWDFIADLETRIIYDAILDRVRHAPLCVRLPFRCDSPAVRRFMELEIIPLNPGHVAFNSRLLRREKRPPLHLLQPDRRRADRMLIMCGWCKKIELSAVEWVEAEEGVARLGLFDQPLLPRISHGICPSCNERLHSGLQALQTKAPGWDVDH